MLPSWVLSINEMTDESVEDSQENRGLDRISDAKDPGLRASGQRCGRGLRDWLGRSPSSALSV